jgi:hypothetical protein
MSNAQWYYSQDGKPVGPITLVELSRLVSERRVAMTDLVWSEGLPDWRPASAVDALVAASPRPAPLTPGPTPHAGPAYPQPQWGPVQYATPQPSGESHQGMAVAGFICSLLFPLLGLIFSWIALAGMKRTGNPQGKGLAVAGLVISLIYFGFVVIMFVSCFGMALVVGMSR